VNHCDAPIIGLAGDRRGRLIIDGDDLRALAIISAAIGGTIAPRDGVAVRACLVTDHIALPRHRRRATVVTGTAPREIGGRDIDKSDFAFMGTIYPKLSKTTAKAGAKSSKKAAKSSKKTTKSTRKATKSTRKTAKKK